MSTLQQTIDVEGASPLSRDDPRADTESRRATRLPPSPPSSSRFTSENGVEGALNRRLEDAQREAVLQHKIRELEGRLERQRQSEEEHRAVFARERRSSTQQATKSAALSASSSASSVRLRRPVTASSTANGDQRLAAKPPSKVDTVVNDDKAKKAMVTGMKKRQKATEPSAVRYPSTAAATTPGRSISSATKNKALREVRLAPCFTLWDRQ